MSNLFSELKKDLIDSLKQKDKNRIETIRLILAAIKNFEIKKYPPSNPGKLTDKDILEVLTKQAKQHRESIEAYKQGKRNDLVEKEQKQLDVVEIYLPKQLNDNEILTIVKEVIDGGADKFGAVMSRVMEKVKGRADGKRVASVVQGLLKS